MKTLNYGSNSMTREPVNQSFGSTLRQLEPYRSSTYVVLEPGDGTRYDVIVTRVDRQSFYVSRIVGGDLLNTDPVLVQAHMHEKELKAAITPLIQGNAWTAMLMTWWLAELFQAQFYDPEHGVNR